MWCLSWSLGIWETFAIIESVQQIIRDTGWALNRAKVGVLRVGFVGRKVIKALKRIGVRDIRGVDINSKSSRKTKEGLRLGNDFSMLTDRDLVIILTTR